MSVEQQAPARSMAADTAVRAFVFLLGATLAARIAALHFNPIGLHFDEAQYWSWSRALDWGYYTKPPMIAWAIAATTSLFGDAEWAVRLAAPLAHGAAAAAIFALTRNLYGGWAGFAAGLAWLAMPAVWFSSSLISTDALLLPFWAFALLALERLIATRAWAWALALGAAIGLGALAKYAMLYFPLCMALAALWLAPVRSALSGARGFVIALIAAAIVAPNLIWNAENGFATISHTADNLDLGADMFSLSELNEFLTGQVLLFGPIMFFAMLALVWRARAGLADRDKLLIAFIAPPLLIVTLLAYVTRANANWAVVSYVAATAWVAGSLLQGRIGRRWLVGALVLNIAIGAAMLFAALNPDLSGRFRGVRDARGWEETAQHVAAAAEAHPGLSAVMVDDRSAYYELAYYWTRDGRALAPAPLRMWLLHGRARIAAEAAAPMRAEEGRRVLIVHLSNDYRALIARDFARIEPIGEVEIPLGAGRARKFGLSIGEGFAPAPRDGAFAERLQALRGRR